MITNVKILTGCRLCGGPLETVYDYGELPAANALCSTIAESLSCPRFEQKLMFCRSCLLGQLSAVVAPEFLYTGYVYQSSVSPVFRRHCRGLAEAVSVQLGMERNPVVVDIAGNDGCLMREIIHAVPYARGVVIDPAARLENDGFSGVPRFWNHDTAGWFRSEYGKADIVTAQNVVGHVDEITEFFQAVRDSLKTQSRFVVEVPSFRSLVNATAFDTVYHEHVSYWTISAMVQLAGKTGLEVLKVEEFPDIHCGTLRFWMAPGSGCSERVKSLMEEERNFFSGSLLFAVFRARIARKLYSLRAALTTGRIVGVTASAKSSVLLNMLGNEWTKNIACLVDDAPLKHGKYSPGTPIPVVSFQETDFSDFSAAVIMSRNLTALLTDRLTAAGFSGITIGV